MGLFAKLRKSSGSNKLPKSTCLIPLYIYPTNSSTWQPLLDAIDANPSLDFIVIVNPNSGPGSPPWWPNLDYLREVPKLNARSNCTTVGYVRVDYCNRDVAEVVEEIHQYAQWSQQNGVKGLHVSGIFFDETPNVSSQFKTTYLTKIDQEVKATQGILGERLIIHNPGTLPDAVLESRRPEITAVFEESYARLLQPDPEENKLLVNYDREKACYMVHSVAISAVKKTTCELRKRAQYLFVTDSAERYYEQFGAGFKDFIDAMAEE